MRLYLAAVYTSSYGKHSQVYLRHTDAEKVYRDQVQYILESYHYISRQSYADKIREDNAKIFLDSGAFSAFTKGEEIDLPAYCDFVVRNKDILEVVDGQPLFSVLDGIGDPKKTGINQQWMENVLKKDGLRPLPCYHYGEPPEYLEWYLEHYDYITLGGMVPISTKDLYLWLDTIFEEYLVDGSGRPKVKVHGFGLTTIGIMERYPWYSVDSSSWVQVAANGSLWIPDWGTISVSKNSPTAKEQWRHLDTLPTPQHEAVKKLILDKGFDLERIQNDYSARWSFNCWSFTELNNRTNRKNKVFLRDQPQLFSYEMEPNVLS
jgi:hypothetical protein